ncbi:malonate decarboxylase subunit epsilon [Planococcus sp. CPCC 101016]|uniref:ACP S-malonyltransferase n=1 Tax=Planococcus sp. CPCC 101016 TaxID=2599617 RepID=UPI0011B5DBF9|nr:malonate decarboxylase subunit epsilon [Planococcus sp. CPCC 101016]TWT08037.1 malonate decarboxylase subunit epsilon [Planococcus sp. CPCC 101016]
MKLAFLFPGQGSQMPGLLSELPESEATRKVLDSATESLNENIFNFHSPDALRSTTAVQISLLSAGVAAFKAFESEGVKPDFVAGHSVGAFSAAVAAGVLEFGEAVKIVKIRGELMESAYPTGYGMGVVLGMDSYNVQSIIDQHFDKEYPVFIANQNGPDQLTISGAISAIQKVLIETRRNGARRAELLNVSTPSHCQLLLPVAEKLAEALQQVKIYPPSIPYAGNRNARILSNPFDIRQDLAESVSSPVKWHDASTVLYEKGVRLFIEMPPGAVLSRLAAKAFPDARVLSVAENGFDDCQFIAKREKLK